MRIHIKTSPSRSVVPFDHLHYLVGTIHKWLGKDNDYHGQQAMHSFSWLQGASKATGGLVFQRGASFFVSAHDADFIRKLMNGIMDDAQVFAGMEVQEARLQYTPVFDQKERQFSVASPVLIKKREGERVKHFLYDDEGADDLLVDTMHKKLTSAGLNPEGLALKFDRKYSAAHTKLINYRGVKNRASVCPVVVTGSAEQLGFIWEVGVGNSTGIGFGALN